jgi:hypothetical protein
MHFLLKKSFRQLMWLILVPFYCTLATSSVFTIWSLACLVTYKFRQTCSIVLSSFRSCCMMLFCTSNAVILQPCNCEDAEQPEGTCYCTCHVHMFLSCTMCEYVCICAHSEGVPTSNYLCMKKQGC